jgi:hypothetical protein
MKKMVLYIILTLFMCTAMGYAQSISVRTFGVSPRAVEEDSVAHYFDSWYTGLQNVGNQSKVYLEVTSSAKLNTPVWTFISKPAGSVTAFGATNDIDTSNQVIFFNPDKVGTYKIVVADGSLKDTITINSALFVGYETGACYVCHNGAFVPQGVPLFSNWQGTAHSTATSNGLDGVFGSHFGESCLQCHTTGYDTLATNGGFDDYPFVFPTVLQPGMNDSMKAAYPQAMALANVQCEACHGPGNMHYGAPDKMSVSLSPELCGYCHDATGAHEFYSEQYYASVHANPTTLARGSSTSCAPCHSGSGFVSWIKGGKTALTSAPAVQKIACAVCHDPHDATNEFQLRTATVTFANGVTESNIGAGALCMNCHQSRQEAVDYTNNYLKNLSHYGPHHGPQGDIVAGTNGYQFGWKFPTSPHMQAADGCIDCHMSAAGVNSDGTTRQLFGSHSLNMVDPVTGDDNVSACAPCHGTIGTKFSDKKFYVNGNADLDGDGVANGLQIEVQGLLDRIATYLPNTNGPDSTWTLLEAEAYFNWDMVTEDKSLGIHNPQYIYSLLAVTLQKLDPTTGIKLIDNTVPQVYSLGQNYPNPFNPTTTINYTIPKEGNVKIEVYDITGKLVTTLVNSSMSGGKYSVTWNGKNSSGQNVGSGIYLYRIQASDFVSVKKMVMLK